MSDPRFRIVVRHEHLARTPLGEMVEVDARIEHVPDEGEAKLPTRQGVLEVTRIDVRDIAIGQWRPR